MEPSSFQFEIPSDLAAAREVQSRILQEVEQRQFVAEAAFAIKLALEEALINAIRHGNKCDCHKKVHIEARVADDRAEISIEDEGCGFDRGEVPDPTTDENIYRVHGRGILLIEAYMDEVKYSRGGRRVRMLRYNRPENCRCDP